MNNNNNIIISLLTFKEPLDGRNFGRQIAQALSLLDFQPSDLRECPASPHTRTEARGAIPFLADDNPLPFPETTCVLTRL